MTQLPVVQKPEAAFVVLPKPPTLPRVSVPLARLMADLANGYAPEDVVPSLRKEAQDAADRFGAICEDATYEVIVAWLLPFATGCDFPLSREDFFKRAHDVADTIAAGEADEGGRARAKLPMSVFTAANQRAGLLQFTYFPTAKKLYDWMAPQCRDWIRDRDLLRRLLSVTAPPPAPKLTDEVRHAITARFRQQIDPVIDQARRDAEAVMARADGKPAGRVATVPTETLAALRAANPRMQQAIHDHRAAQALAAATARPGMPPKPPVHRPPGKRPVMPWHDQAGDVA